MKESGAQGMIVWDVEGEQFPHKTTYLGDPRVLARVAPEAEGVMDEFFRRFRDAGFAVGLTIRPQQLTFGSDGVPFQKEIPDYERLLLEKIDYAQKRWGASLFYVDSNSGPRSPAELFHLRRIAHERPRILLIPEHHFVLYYAFSAPYSSMQRGDQPTPSFVRRFYPDAFQVLSIADSGRSFADIAEAQKNRDILLFPAWFQNLATRTIDALPK